MQFTSVVQISTLTMEEAKKIACVIIDQHNEELHMLSQSIWSHPELAFNEHYAHSFLTDYLEKSGFHVEKSYKLPTAFKAKYRHGDSSTEGLNIAVLCEYDALPGIGHACGHNLIAEVGVATAVAVKAVMVATNQALGTVRNNHLILADASDGEVKPLNTVHTGKGQTGF